MSGSKNDLFAEFSSFIISRGLPFGHGEKSVIRVLQWGRKMTNDEILAIRCHIVARDLAFQSPEQKRNLGVAKAMSPLLTVVKAADGLASFMLETRWTTCKASYREGIPLLDVDR